MELGGEEAVLSAPHIAETGFFGDVAGCLGFRLGQPVRPARSRNLYLRRIEVESGQSGSRADCRRIDGFAVDLRPFVSALEARARDFQTHPILQIEAAAGLMRFALRERRWKSSAIAALVAIEPGDDISRVRCFAGWPLSPSSNSQMTMLSISERIRRPRTIVISGSYELGLVHIGRALMCRSLAEIAKGFDCRKSVAGQVAGRERGQARFQDVSIARGHLDTSRQRPEGALLGTR